jgi:hypothetical protein
MISTFNLPISEFACFFCGAGAGELCIAVHRFGFRSLPLDDGEISVLAAIFTATDSSCSATDDVAAWVAVLAAWVAMRPDEALQWAASIWQ